MKRQRIFAGVLALGLLLALAAGVTLAQGQEPPEGEMQPQGALSVTGSVASTISYQGMLKENGSPVDGSRNMIFRLYSDDGCTTQVGSYIDVGSVQVNDGFFDVDLAVDQDDFNGQALWLEAEVGGATIGCEEIQPVPYALSLRPGAVISTSTWLAGVPNLQGNVGSSADWKLGDLGWAGMPPMVSSIFGIRGNASSGGLAAYGVEGSAESTDGTAYGVYGFATSDTGEAYGVYASGSTDDLRLGGSIGSIRADNLQLYGNSSVEVFLDNDGDENAYFFVRKDSNEAVFAVGEDGTIRSTAETEIVVSPLKTVVDSDLLGNPEVRPCRYGTVALRPSATGEHFAYVPVDLFSQLFGVSQMLKSITVCYSLDNASSYIADLVVYYTDDNGGRVELISDPTDRTSTTWECYTASADPSPGVIGGPVFIRFGLQYSGTGSLHDIQIGNITLTLVE